jgi:hypothetical protein
MLGECGSRHAGLFEDAARAYVYAHLGNPSLSSESRALTVANRRQEICTIVKDVTTGVKNIRINRTGRYSNIDFDMMVHATGTNFVRVVKRMPKKDVVAVLHQLQCLFWSFEYYSSVGDCGIFGSQKAQKPMKREFKAWTSLWSTSNWKS